MLPINQPLQNLINAGITHLASCWQIDRTDGVTLLFTDHDAILTINGVNFLPAGSFSASARQKTSGLNEHNLEIVGVLDSTAITHEDLRAGRYREAKVTEYVVDWKYPWIGIIATHVWWIGDTTFEDGKWSAAMTGITRWFSPAIGRIYGRICNWDLGDANCRFDTSTITVTPAFVNTVVAGFAKKKFISPGLIGAGAAAFLNGKVTWLSGDNAGIAAEVKNFNTLTGEVDLYFAMPADIQVGDSYSIVRGCDKASTTCIGVFNNIVNFGGFPFIPGTDASLQYPGMKIPT